MTTAFIADLHLSPARPDITAAFSDFCQQQRHTLDALYILGDLFDAWLGDDDPSDFAGQIKSQLRALSEAGVRFTLCRAIVTLCWVSALRRTWA